MKRAAKPRAPVAVAAAMVSQLTCLALLGVDPRRYLDHVVTLPACKPHVVALGRLRLLPLDVTVEALRALAAQGSEPTAEANEPEQPENVEEVLAALGLERAS